jgi:multidrug resistance efflux pump
MARNLIFQISWILLSLLLIVLAFSFRRQSDQIVAQVEPQKIGISFHKPVRIKTIHVMPGQQVKPGDLLVEVERPDLLLELEERETTLRNLENELAALDVEFKADDRKNQLDHQSLSRKYELEIEQLEHQARSNKVLLQDFGLTFRETAQSDTSLVDYYRTRIDALREQLRTEAEQFASRQNFLQETYREKRQILLNKIQQVELEIGAQLREKEELVRISTISGTVGALSAEREEIVPAFQTIMSIYAQHPTIIKAFMNESIRYPVNAGDKVQVTSTNRSYSIEGEITEVGSRIVEYPQRLRARSDMAMWGQELFIRIPENNAFLNGEKVIVIFN